MPSSSFGVSPYFARDQSTIKGVSIAKMLHAIAYIWESQCFSLRRAEEKAEAFLVRRREGYPRGRRPWPPTIERDVCFADS